MPTTIPVDPDVKMPAAVRRAAARSAELMAAQQPEGQQEQQQQPQQNGEQPPAEQQEQQPFEQQEQQQQQSQQNGEQKPNDGWEHRYKSLEGRFRAQERAIRDQGEQIANYQRLFATMQHSQQQQPSQQPQPNQQQTQQQRLVTEEEEKEYGTEFLSVVERKARERYDPVVNQMQQQLQQLQAQVGSSVEAQMHDARGRMFSRLAQEVPDWQQINRNENFLRWLSLPDTYSGVIRDQLLNAAYQRADANAVTAFFKGFLSEEAATDPTRAGNQLPAAQQAAGKVSLEQLAAPGRAKTAPGNAPAEKPRITTGQITAFYTDIAAGKYRGNEQEQKRLERMIFEAQMEGRIIQQ